ncbi:MAG: zinc-binding dehydrogenase, partial [Acetomicrobium sp.]
GIHGAELADIGIGDTVIVFGVGPVGLMAVAGARLRGASRILVTGTRPKCVEAAKLYGATHVINYKIAPVDEQVLEITNGAGVDVAIIAGGNPDTLATAVKITKPGGNISNVNYFGEGDILPIPRLEWGCGMAHKTIRGGLCPGGRLRMEKLIELVRYGRVDPGKLVTHVFKGFDRIEEALMLMKDKPRDLIKPVVLIQ